MSNVPWKLLGCSICGSLPIFLEMSVRFLYLCTQLWTRSNYSDLELEMDAEEFLNKFARSFMGVFAVCDTTVLS